MTCCTDDKCNDKFPSSSDSGVDHAKVGQVVFIMGLVATIFFAYGLDISINIYILLPY